MSDLICLIYDENRIRIAGTSENGAPSLLHRIPTEYGASDQERLNRLLTDTLGLGVWRSYPQPIPFAAQTPTRLIFIEAHGQSALAPELWFTAAEVPPPRPEDQKALRSLTERLLQEGCDAPWMAPLKRLTLGQSSPSLLRVLEQEGSIRKSDRESTPSQQWAAIAAAGTLGLGFDYFFSDSALGISALLFTLLLPVAVFASGIRKRHSLLDGFLLGAAGLLAATYGLFNNAALQALNALGLPLLMTAYVLSVRYDFFSGGILKAPAHLLWKLVPQSLSAALKLFPFSTALLRPKAGAEKPSELRGQVLKGLVLGIPLLLFVTLLLTSSDAVMARFLSKWLEPFDLSRWEETLGHLLTIALTTTYFFGYLWSLRYDYSRYAGSQEIRRNWEPVTLLTVMALLCSVYVLFTGIQFTYLYCGAQLPEGITYADYARRGFAELVTVAFLNTAVILTGVAKSRETTPRLEQAIRAVSTLMALLTLNLLVSAFYRMHLYEAAYGYTVLRLFVQFFEGFLAALLLALTAWIWNRRFPLGKTALVTAIAFYLALNYVNVDRLIAHNNLARTEGTLDFYYLSTLSVDAWPEIQGAQKGPLTKQRLVSEFLAMHEQDRLPGEMNPREEWFEYNYHQALFRSTAPPAVQGNALGYRDPMPSETYPY